MENWMPNLIGERLPIVTYVDPVTFQKIEDLRGDVSRSRFVGKIIQKALHSKKQRKGNPEMKRVGIATDNKQRIVRTSVPAESCRARGTEEGNTN
jgi:hypothetical protein